MTRRPSTLRHHGLLGAAALLLAVALPCETARARSPQQPAGTSIAAVTQDGALVRSGPVSTYYPFARLDAGSLVRVVGEKDQWARVQTIGPAFEGVYGYVSYPRDDRGQLRIAADGRSAVTLGWVDVLAPNLNSDGNPRDSWKTLAKLEANEPLQIIETLAETDEVVHKVVLPPSATGWMSTAHLRPATAAETAQWEAATAEVIPAERAGRAAGSGIGAAVPPSEVRSAAPIVAAPGAAAPQQTARVPFLIESPEAGPLLPLIPSTPLEVVTLPPAQAAPPAPGDWQAMLEDLEAKYTLLQDEDIKTAEVDPLRELYLELGRASAEAKPQISRYAETRAEQLVIWARLQERTRELAALQLEAESASAEATAARHAIERSGPYVAVGRLADSSIYDGKRLPLLLRLQDPGTGRTIAYLHPGAGELRDDLHALIGHVIGVVGTKEYDGAMRLNMITAEHIEPLTPAEPTATVEVPTG